MDLSYTIFLVFTLHHHPTPPQTFFGLERGPDISHGLGKGKYDSSMVIGGHNFKVDYKMDIKRVHSGVTREYFELV